MRDWWKIGLAVSVVAALLYMTAVGALAFISHQTTRRPAEPVPVIEVIRVDDPDLATALMIVGQQQVEIQNLIHLHTQYGRLLDLYQEELLRKVVQK